MLLLKDPITTALDTASVVKVENVVSEVSEVIVVNGGSVETVGTGNTEATDDDLAHRTRPEKAEAPGVLLLLLQPPLLVTTTTAVGTSAITNENVNTLEAREMSAETGVTETDVETTTDAAEAGSEMVEENVESVEKTSRWVAWTKPDNHAEVQVLPKSKNPLRI